MLCNVFVEIPDVLVASLLKEPVKIDPALETLEPDVIK